MASRTGMVLGIAALATVACAGVCCSGGLLGAGGLAAHDATTESDAERIKRIADRGRSDKAIRDKAMQGECKMVTADVEACIEKYKEEHGDDLPETKTPEASETPNEEAGTEPTVPPTPDAPNASVEPEAEEPVVAGPEAAPGPKQVNLETLWTATQTGYLVNEEGRMEGTFKPGQPEGTLVGTLTTPSTTEVSGQFKYTEESTGILGFGDPDFIIKPYGATSITWPDGGTLALTFSESEPGMADYTREAHLTNSSRQQVTLNAFANSQASTTAWYAYIPGRGTAESCDPLRERYSLDTKTYALKIVQEKSTTTRTDCQAD